MYFKLSNGVAFLLMPLAIMIYISLLPNVALAQEVEKQHVIFQVKPSMCVALNQGRTCYAQVKIQFSSSLTDDFCIVKKRTDMTQRSNSDQQQIKCWKQSKGDAIHFEFQSSESITYQLMTHKNEAVAETTVDVSWVHEKSPRKRRWRLF